MKDSKISRKCPPSPRFSAAWAKQDFPKALIPICTCDVLAEDLALRLEMEADRLRSIIQVRVTGAGKTKRGICTSWSMTGAGAQSTDH